MPKKTEQAAAPAGDAQAAEVAPADDRKAALLAELAEVEAAEKRAAKVEYPKVLYKDGESVTVDHEAAHAALGDGWRDTPAPVKG